MPITPAGSRSQHERGRNREKEGDRGGGGRKRDRETQREREREMLPKPLRWHYSQAVCSPPVAQQHNGWRVVALDVEGGQLDVEVHPHSSCVMVQNHLNKFQLVVNAWTGGRIQELQGDRTGQDRTAAHKSVHCSACMHRIVVHDCPFMPALQTSTAAQQCSHAAVRHPPDTAARYTPYTASLPCTSPKK